MITSAPHYVAPGANRSAKRILLVAPSFPPAVEVGALRWQKIASLAAARGWGFDVITGAAADDEVRDERRLETLPAGTRVWIVPMPEPPILRWHRRAGRLLRAFSEGRDAVAGAAIGPSVSNAEPTRSDSSLRSVLNTARAFSFFQMWRAWGDEVLEVAQQIVQECPPDLIASSGPPHMAHLAAHRIARAAGKPLLIDLRDPWFLHRQQPVDMRSALWRSQTKKDEVTTCNASSLIVTNTEACADMMRDRYPALTPRILAVMNGSDPDVRAFARFNDEAFEIVHTGTVYFGRDPRNLFKAVKQLLDSVQEAGSVVSVRFVGAESYNGVPLKTIAADCGIDQWFSCSPPVDRSEALRICGGAAVNVLLPQDEPLAIPSKVFEYMQFPAWILALAKPDDAVAQLLEGTPSRAVVPENVQGISTFLVETFRAWAQGARPQPLNADGCFDRSRQVDRLLDAIDALG